jgi:hypothetical protein
VAVERAAPGPGVTCALYHNDGKGHFTDVTRGGRARRQHDRDGRRHRRLRRRRLPGHLRDGDRGNRLFHNLGNGTFADVTDAAGSAATTTSGARAPCGSTSSATGSSTSSSATTRAGPPETSLQDAFAAEINGPSYTAPAGFVSAFPTVYRNLGNGKFVGCLGQDRAQPDRPADGIPPRASPRGGRGRRERRRPARPALHLPVGRDLLFLNQGDGTFRPWTPPPRSAARAASAGLVGAGASPSPARPGLGPLRDPAAAGLAMAPSRTRANLSATWGQARVALLDYDLDGRIDIVSGNGLAEPALLHFEHGRDFDSARRSCSGTTARGGCEAHRAPRARAPWAARWSPAGVAVADVYGDGNLDVVIAQNGGPPRLCATTSARTTRGCGSTSSAPTASATRAAPGWRWTRPAPCSVQTMEPAMGYMAQSEKTLTFGLGSDDRVRKVVVRWPSGVRPGGQARRASTGAWSSPSRGRIGRRPAPWAFAAPVRLQFAPKTAGSATNAFKSPTRDWRLRRS